MYSAGMPIVNLFMAAYCFFTFWIDKATVLKGSKRPPLYDCQLPVEASTLLLFAGPLHVVFAIGMYSHLCTFPSEPLSGAIADLSESAASQAGSAGGADMTSNG